MRSTNLKASLIRSALAASLLLGANGLAVAQSVSLTAAETTTTLPDGQTVRMWGYGCGGVSGTGVSCVALNANASGAWSPVLITVPRGSLTINLTNGLHVPTSIVIDGQLGGGLGDAPQRMSAAAFPHNPQGTTWPGVQGTPSSCDQEDTFCPPAQAQRVRSFGTEVQAVSGSTASTGALTWDDLQPGTYLFHSGTQPSIQHPMGLYGMLVVTDAAYPGVTFDADLPVLLSEIDPVQNEEVAQVVQNAGFSDEVVWSGQVGACGDVTQPATAHTCYPPAVNYDPRYFLINGTAFDRTLTPAQQRAAAMRIAPAIAEQGRVLLRLANAGLRMHVPSVVGADLTLHAEDGNILPGVPKVQDALFLAAGKTFDVTIQPKRHQQGLNPNNYSYDIATYALFDRALGLSTNNQRDGGMQAYINVGNGAIPSARVVANAANDTYKVVVVGGSASLVVSDPAQGVLANDQGIYGARLVNNLDGSAPPAGVTLNPNGTFSYNVTFSSGGPPNFRYCGNNSTDTPMMDRAACANVVVQGCGVGNNCRTGQPTANDDAYTSNVATRAQISPPGVLGNDSDPAGLALTAELVGNVQNGTVTLNPDGSFVATPTTPPTGTDSVTVTFRYRARNAQHSLSPAPAAFARVTFNGGSGLSVNVRDAKDPTRTLSDYRWIIEEDRTVFIDPAAETSSGAAPVRNVAINFHTSHTPVVAQGCVGEISCESGQTMLDTRLTIPDPTDPTLTIANPTYGGHVNAVCDIGNGVCRPGAAKAEVDPGQVHLDPSKRYYISILPGDAADDTTACPTAAKCAHGMGGAQIAAGQGSVDVYVQPLPYNPAKIAVFVFEDDNPLNGEHDGGGPITTVAQHEPGLGGFNITLLDQAGNRGDSAGQITYDESGQPVTNALAGTIDPATGLDACPIGNNLPVGQIVTCPKYESDGVTESPLGGQAIIDNMYPGFYEVQVAPAADRIARGEEWVQTNTLDGTKAIEAFIKPGEPGYFQEFGPGGYHVAVGFANPAVINARKGTPGDGLSKVCSNLPAGSCSATIRGQVTALRMSRTPDQRVYSSGDYTAYSFTQCYASLGAPDSEDFAFAKCNPDGTFEFTGLPLGNYKVTVFDQWNDLLVDGLSTPVQASTLNADGSPNTQCTGTAPALTCTYEIAVTEWRTNLYGRIFIDENGDGVSQEKEPGLPLVPYNLRFRDGSYVGVNNTDMNGYAGFNEVFPFLNWLVVDMDSARYKLSGVHVVYDAGGPADGAGGGESSIAAGFANTIESDTAHLPAELRVPGARYCSNADCPSGDDAGGSTGRVDPGWATTQGWQGLLGNSNFIEFAMKPFKDATATTPAENGGIRGHVLYTPTRPFDDPALLLQLAWAAGIPNVKVNLYRQAAALGTDGVTPNGMQTLELVDTTFSTSWDDWAQGFRRDADGNPLSYTFTDADGTHTGFIPNMSCPGQETTSPFYFTMKNGTQALNPDDQIAARGRFRCYDGWSMLSQVQPAPYNGMYKFPSVVAKAGATNTLPADDNWTVQLDPTSYKTNCKICVTNPDDGTPMLPAGKYVVEVVVPQGYELVKEEDKNILLGDVYVAAVEAQFGFASVFIMPDQAAVRSSYNPYNALQPTTINGAVPRREGDTGSVEVFWPCAGEKRIVPDLISLYPGAAQQTPFAGALRPLCDRKEVVLGDEMTVLAKFYLHTSAHIAGHYAGTITNDFASEFDPFSPQFGEKFAVPNTPVGIRDFSGKEISRVYADQWGIYNGMNFSSWTVNPPSPSGYIPQMMIACMNDPGPILDTRAGSPTNGQMITDPAYNPAYSNFCYEIPFMPGQTQYLDTPVVPTMAFAAGYNLPDCEYPDATPAIKSVVGSSGVPGPWVANAGATLTIAALGTKTVLNHAYSGPNATAAPFNRKFITRDYLFGSSQGSGSVTIGGVNAAVNSWDDHTIVVTVPEDVPLCAVQQRGQPPARCGELEITAANGRKSVDAVTVTIGGKAPTVVTPTSPGNGLFDRLLASPLQSAIDAAEPGDLIIVTPGTYNENLLMWKPVRLQGVAAASVTVNGDAHPAGKLDSWRRQVVCLFGLTLQGRPADGPYEGCPDSQFMKVDRNDREGIIGWDATVNGNVAQQLQEPTLMGAYEGAGVTVLGKGVKYPAGADPFALANAGAFPAGSLYLNGTTDCANDRSGGFDSFDHATSNFRCAPSRIDGLSIINSSQGGGGIFVHGFNHLLEIANNRVYANHGTLSGGIVVGTPEFGTPYIVGGVDPVPFPIPAGSPDGLQLGYGKNTDVFVHHNSVTSNASIGDALFSAVNSAAGGVSFCTGADAYRMNDNWVCGNLSSGDGGGVAHIGFSNDGRIARNWILFNQSQSPTIPTNGGGLAILGASPDRTLPDGTECGTLTDADCPPGLAEGTGRNLVIDANLILGNSAESGSGGGLRLQLNNGQDVIAFPRTSSRWNDITVTNNIIANNVAGWDGGGVSLQDALKVRFINNTVISNDTTASAGVLFNTLGAPFASALPGNQCAPISAPSATCPRTITTSTVQPAGLVTMKNTSNLTAAIADVVPNGSGTRVACPSGYGYTGSLNDGSCTSVALPLLSNNVFWKNRAFHIGVGNLGPASLGQDQQKVVTLYPSLTQATTGVCANSGVPDPDPSTTAINRSSDTVYWDLGVRGDTQPSDHGSLYTLAPQYSILSATGADYSGSGNLIGSDPAVISAYCNGSRLPPEGGGLAGGFNTWVGRSETTGLYPVFALNQITPAATVDEGNNWINLTYGPLSLGNPSILAGGTGYGVALGNYALTNSSPAINVASAATAPNHDFFGTARPQGSGPDIGAVECVGAPCVGAPPPPPAFPALGVLDNFNRSNATTLNYGTNWLQFVLGGAGVRVNSNQAWCVNTGLSGLLCLPSVGADAFWANAFGPRQAAAFTFANGTVNNDALYLKGSGSLSVFSVPQNAIRVRHNSGQVFVETTANSGLTFTVAGSFAGTFASGNTLTAMADAGGTVYVWRTVGTTTTLLGQAATGAAFAGGGRIGLHLSSGSRVDNFAGGNVP